ncbi:lipocalin family protein [uncultured Croceitalea sp.]|uniref:lipocalin family protein n=1 Tax=uncultured Croceitalea sp. TaxID=1798908 RepID=UPI003305D231
MMKIRKVKHGTAMPFVWVLMVLTMGQALKAQALSKNAICKNWKLDKYLEEGVYYAPKEVENQDYLQLNKDMTFEAKMEGESYSGSWMLNTNGEYLELKYKTKEVEKLRIQHLTAATLVLTYDVEPYRYTEAHYVTCQ